MEIIIVIVLVGILAGFGLRSYINAIQKTREREMASNLKAMYAANSLYRAQVRQYLSGVNSNLAFINTNLGLSIIGAGIIYTYNGAAGAYTIRADWRNTANNNLVSIIINEQPLANNNPCCLAGLNGCLVINAC